MNGTDAESSEMAEKLRGRVARADRFAPISGVIGAVFGASSAAALLLMAGEMVEGGLLGVVAGAVSGGAWGAVLGHFAGGGALWKRIDDATGYDLRAERVRRAIGGEPESLSPEETDRARHAAAVAAIVLPARRTREVLLTVGLGVSGVALLVAGLTLARPEYVVVPAVCLLNAFVSASRIRSMTRQNRAARAFLAEAVNTSAD